MGYQAKGSRLDVTERGLDFPAPPKHRPGRRGFPGPPKLAWSAFDFPPPPKCRRVAAASLCRRPPLHPPRCVVRLRLPSTYASPVVRHRPGAPSAASDIRRPLPSLGDVPARFDPARSPRQQAAVARRARPRLRGCLSRSLPTADWVFPPPTPGSHRERIVRIAPTDPSALTARPLSRD
jgi:hypothetical protein